MERNRFVGAALLIALAGACAADHGYPNRPIELVVPFQAGGGSDTLARTIQHVLSEQRIVPVPVNVVNRSGGAGAIGLAYVAAKQGDTHTLAVIADPLLTVPLQPGYGGPTYRDLTVVAVLTLDDMLVVVPSKSRFQTIEALLAAAKADPGNVTFATESAGGVDHIFGGMIERATGAKFSYVHTRGGAEAMQHIIGGHVDVAVPNPGEAIGHLQGGFIRVLAVGSAKRLPMLPDVPTLKERGVGVEHQVFRGIALPAGVSPETVSYWNDALRRVVQSDRWQRDYLQPLDLTPSFKGPEGALSFLAATERTYRSTLEQLGMIRR
jgi:putative tricarboxylic transport membrane protein